MDTMQKKSMVGRKQTVKKALVAKRVSKHAAKGEQVKVPLVVIAHNKV